MVLRLSDIKSCRTGSEVDTKTNESFKRNLNLTRQFRHRPQYLRLKAESTFGSIYLKSVIDGQIIVTILSY